jgi:membrane-associated HD superfamily phosphohydrolase
MLARSAEPTIHFTRRDAGRLIAASVVLVIAMSAILGLDILPAQSQLEVDKPVITNVFAPRSGEYPSKILTDAAREAARDDVGDQYDFTAAQAEAIAVQQAQAFGRLVRPVDAAFAEGVQPEDRAALLATALPALTAEQTATLVALAPERWLAVRTEAARVLDTLERTELKDPQVALVRANLAGRMAGDLTADERQLAAAMIEPFVVANSAFSPQLTEIRRQQAAAAVPDVVRAWEKDDIIVRSGDRVTKEAFEAIEYFNLNEGGVDVARLAGFVVLSILVIGLLLTWTWRFRREFWHRNNVLLLLSLLRLPFRPRRSLAVLGAMADVLTEPHR